ncbi:MAG: ribonuclease III [bacterium]|jgi:ribonuclease-3|nr:ribonuclease III [bacterium]
MRWTSIIQAILGRRSRAVVVAPGGDDDTAIDEASLLALEEKIDYRFVDRTLLANALLHRSHVHVTGQERGSSNERLEFLGDAVLGLIVNEHLYRHFGDCSEGDLTKMKSLLVCGACLSEVAGEHDLGVHILMSRSEAATGGRERSSILADTTEAIIGAVYLDGGLEAARGVIQRILLDGADRVLTSRSERNYKSRLQELIQAEHKTPPRYRVVAVEGPDHDRVFRVAVSFDGRVLGVGEGRNKKAAEQTAAAAALAALEQGQGFPGSADS